MKKSPHWWLRANIPKNCSDTRIHPSYKDFLSNCAGCPIRRIFFHDTAIAGDTTPGKPPSLQAGNRIKTRLTYLPKTRYDTLP